MLDVVVDVAVNNPGARVVKWSSEDDISICWNLYSIFENGVVKVAWQTTHTTSIGALLVHLDDELSGDVIVKLTLSNDVVPASMLVNGVSYLSWFTWVGIDKNYFKPFANCLWLLKDMTARCRLLGTCERSMICTHCPVADSSTTTSLV